MKDYKNSYWLYRKYWIEDLSTVEMAIMCKIVGTTIRRWMKKFRIPRRSMSEARKLWYKLHPMGKGKDSPGWKGGRVKSGGYIYIYQPNHPYADPKGYVAEHRLMAEKALDRYLKPGEFVHHINGIRDDNRNSNFVICTRVYHGRLEAKMADLYKKEHFLGEKK